MRRVTITRPSPWTKDRTICLAPRRPTLFWTSPTFQLDHRFRRVDHVSYRTVPFKRNIPLLFLERYAYQLPDRLHQPSLHPRFAHRCRCGESLADLPEHLGMARSLVVQ